MKLKLQQIVNSEMSLKKLIEIKLPIKIAYKLSKLVNLIQPELTIFTEQRDKLIRELGAEDKDNNVKVTDENLPKFMEELKKLTEIEIDLSFSDGKDIEKIKISDLGDISLEAQDLVLLNWLITE